MAGQRQRRTPIIEWVVGGISLVIVVGTIGYLAFEAFRGGAATPALSVAVSGVRESGGSHVVDLVVRNAGRRAAADVHLAGTVRGNDGRELRSEARVDYVPGFSTRRASLIFQVYSPEADVRIVGYAVP